jgi:hypothetical protein
VPVVIPTDWKPQPCEVSIDSEMREPVSNSQRQLLASCIFKVPRELNAVKSEVLMALSAKIAVFSHVT